MVNHPHTKLNRIEIHLLLQSIVVYELLALFITWCEQWLIWNSFHSSQIKHETLEMRHYEIAKFRHIDPIAHIIIVPLDGRIHWGVVQISDHGKQQNDPYVHIPFQHPHFDNQYVDNLVRKFQFLSLILLYYI